MGTNYYHHSPVCGECGGHDVTHISRNMITFQAVVEWTPDQNDWVVVVGSWQEWKARLLAGGRVWDQYGKCWNTSEFIARVEATLPESRRRQYDWMAANLPSRVASGPTPDGDWLDADGFSFSGSEFS